MEIKAIKTEEAPMAVGPYSQGIAAGNLVFTAGEIPVNPADGSVPEDIEDQARQAIENVFAVFRAAGVDKNRIVSVTVYLKNIDDFPKVNRVYAELFEEPFPARSCIAAAALPKDVGIMVSAIGVKY
ncbi:MAG: RidA family protein [Candidatus Methanomethylophilus sp.]|nr:RidA family protein [Methanomethylophilus sp.]MBQ5483669.1 RidA family protein [Methanomethylophilus sp.]